jgi:hypothetical protein
MSAHDFIDAALALMMFVITLYSKKSSGASRAAAFQSALNAAAHQIVNLWKGGVFRDEQTMRDHFWEIMISVLRASNAGALTPTEQATADTALSTTLMMLKAQKGPGNVSS